MRGGPGRIQRKIVGEMYRYGGGWWPDNWPLPRAKQVAMDGLVRRGMVKRVNTSTGVRYRLVTADQSTRKA